MKKDILILCQYFYPEYVSSATLPTDLAEDLVKKGLSVDVICGVPKEYYDGEKVEKKEVYKGIGIHRVNYTEHNNKTKIGRIINFFSFFFSIVLKTPRMFKYKTIIVYSNPPILPLIPYIISLFTKTKYIFIAYDIYPDNALLLGAISKGSIIEKTMKLINKRVYTTASKVVVLGNEMKSYLIKNKIAINAENLVIIPNWYNEIIENNIEIKNNEFLKIKENRPFVVLYSGNMGPMQDIDTILNAALNLKENKNISFLFCGHGSKVQAIEKFIKENELDNCKLYGFLKGNDYKEVLRISNLTIVSLEKGVEGIGVPSKTYGYFAAGKPVIAIMTDDTDIANNLKEYNAGTNIHQGDVSMLVNLILEYQNNVQENNIRAINSKKLFNDLYRRELCTEKYYEIINELIDDEKVKVGEY
ncbi:glycosyltransferase family 4 protein [Carnobacterium sp.]|uniref:glycosyltransferase family 4 protein n=1 Tax=Carnobacterium sp. TaxID=48221 RepID=UPI00388E0AE2